MHPVPPTRREPALNIPGGLTAAVAILLLIHVGRTWLPDLTDLRLLLEAGFVPARLTIALGWASGDEVIQAAAAGATDPDVAASRTAMASYIVEDGGGHPWSLLTYALLHGSWMHVGLNVVWLVAFGTPVVRRLGSWRALVLAIATSLAGALTHWLLNPSSVQVVIGASAAVSGLMGAATLFAFGEPRAFGARPAARGHAAAFGGLLRNRGALLFLAVWFGVNVVLGLVAAPLGIVEGGIAWAAHIGGLLAGLLLFPVLDRAPMRPD